MKTYWLYSNIGIIGKSHFLFIIDIIDKYMIIMAIYHGLREKYNKYKCI